VAPSCLAWKGQAGRGSGAAFAERRTSKTQRAKGVTATAVQVESIVIRKTIYDGFYLFGPASKLLVNFYSL
jgi:hypothetical protein